MDTIAGLLRSSIAERALVSLALLVLGAVFGALASRWRRYRLQRQAEAGDATEVATIEKVLIEPAADGRLALRIRSCGRDTLEEIFPNPAAREAFHHRAQATTAAKPLLSMDSRLGSYLLQELAIWVCGQVGERDFPHDVWVMAAVCENMSVGGHRSSTVVLVRRDDLAHFRDWLACKAIEVEHGSHGERILTLMQMAREFDRQSAEVARRRAEGLRSNYEETMYVLDLGLDTRSAPLPTKPVPWGRFEATLKELDIE